MRITKEDAAKKYDVTIQSIVNYVKEYMKANNIKAIFETTDSLELMQDYSQMSKEQIIVELSLVK